MLNIEKLIENSKLNLEVKRKLLGAAEDIKSDQTINSPDNFVIDIAKSFARQNGTLIELSGIIPEVLMQKNFKIIDFLINTKVIGIYFVLGFILLFGWFLPLCGIKGAIFGTRAIYWRDYYACLIMLAQLVYYRFLWKKLMP